MKSVGCVLWGSALVSFILATFRLSFIWVAAVLLGLATSLSLLRYLLYRPPENHLAVMYRFGRFGHLVGPDEWSYVIPGIHEIRVEMSLRPRRAEASLEDLWTRDRVPVHCDLLVFYQLDLRRARINFRSQALTIPDEGWHSIVRTVLQEAAGEVVGDMGLDELLSSVGRADLKSTLSRELAERLKGLGIVINLETGVSVQRVKPADSVWRALADLGAAESLGEAARARMQPLLNEINWKRPGVGLDALLVQLAAAVAKDGSIREPLTMSENAVVLAALLEKTGERELVGRPANGVAGLDGDGKRQMELPWRMD